MHIIQYLTNDVPDEVLDENQAKDLPCPKPVGLFDDDAIRLKIEMVMYGDNRHERGDTHECDDRMRSRHFAVHAKKRTQNK